MTLAVILNVVFDVAILGALAFVMSRPVKLTPHAEVVPARRPRERVARERARAREERSSSPWRPALD
ncbi:MAG TPA: hypothetical protein VGO14_03075 [Solirubrobacteraceae bacterium]|jgi:hypothetical protein|nr:hypothetical protein [Solirubrobacteraceae bacterium]